MAYNYEYPYTDPSRVNSDWILHEMKRLITEWAATKSEWGEVKSAFEELRAYVNNYFANLDVQEEINNKLDQMAEDGTLEAIFARVFSQKYFVPSEYITFERLIDLSVEQTYALFDAYVGKGILTKSRIGYATDTDGNDDISRPIYMYRYERKMKQATNFITGAINGRVLLTNALHGNEKMGVPIILTMLHELEKHNPVIEKLFNSFDFDIVPVCNPYGYDVAIDSTYEDQRDNNIGRVNARGVDLNRNGVLCWNLETTGEGTFNYKGTAPLSEKETQALYNLAVTNGENYIFHVDMHTERYSTARNMFGTVECSNSNIRSIFSNVMSELNNRMLSVYGYDVVDELNGVRITTEMGAAPYLVSDRYNKLRKAYAAVLFESPRYNDGEVYPIKSQRFSCDIFINFLMESLYFLSEYGVMRNNLNNYVTMARLTNATNLAPANAEGWFYGSATETYWTPAANSRSRLHTVAEIDLTPYVGKTITIKPISRASYDIACAAYVKHSDGTIHYPASSGWVNWFTTAKSFVVQSNHAALKVTIRNNTDTNASMIVTNICNLWDVAITVS